jgi:signal transduction histidine kinase/DNA-binding response OmpR family regulator
MRLPTFSIRQQILVSMGIVVAVLITGLVAVLVCSIRAALDETGRRVHELAVAASRQQSDVMRRVCDKALAEDETSLRSKAESSARIIAKLAPVPLLTFETEPLTELCHQACADRDVLLCYVADKAGKIRAGAWNAQMQVLPRSPGRTFAESIAELADAWRKAGRVVEVSAEATQDRQTIGRVVVLASRQRVIERQQETQKEFSNLQSCMDRLFGGLRQSLDWEIEIRARRSLLLGVVAALIAAAVGGAAVYRLASSITRSLGRTVTVLEAMAAGDLGQRLPVDRGDEIGRMAAALNTAVESQQRMLLALQETTEAAESANRSKSMFLANMSHEIRTPLNAILGFTELLHSHLETLDPNEARDYLDIVRTSGRHLLTLINDILDLSKIEAGQLQIEIAACSPAEVLAEVISLLRVRTLEKGLRLESTWPHGVPDKIQTDPARLRQLLVNLVGNAIKFTANGGVEVVMDLYQLDGRWWLAMSVIDTGPGIPADKLDSIFDPFVQADSSVTRKFGGTGLGLAICRRIVEALGGTLAVSSELGRGSTFRATIPAGPMDNVPIYAAPRTDAISTKPCPARAAVNLPPARILLVEDGESNRKLITLLLKRAGAQVTTAENGQIGCELALAQPFDLVLMDMQMPVMDGYTAARRLREHGLTVPIVALTAHAMSGDETRCREAGCSGFLTKPIDPDLLVDSMAKMLTALTPAAAEVPEGRRTQPLAPVAAGPLHSSFPDDDADYREIILSFVTHLREKTAAIRRAAAERDYTELARLAHWLKGSGGTAGFAMFTEPARHLEQVAKQSREEEVAAAVDEVLQLAERAAAPQAPSQETPA